MIYSRGLIVYRGMYRFRSDSMYRVGDNGKFRSRGNPMGGGGGEDEEETV